MVEIGYSTHKAAPIDIIVEEVGVEELDTSNPTQCLQP